MFSQRGDLLYKVVCCALHREEVQFCTSCCAFSTCTLYNDAYFVTGIMLAFAQGYCSILHGTSIRSAHFKIERHLCTKYYSYNSFYFLKVSCRTQGAVDKDASLHKVLFKSFKKYYSEDILNFVKVRPSLHSAECSGQMASSFLTGRRCTSLFRKCTQTLGLIIPIIIQPNIYLTIVI